MFDQIMLFIFGLILLIKGGDWFVEGATDIARKFRLPEILIGATVVLIGTTLPEVVVSATSAFQGIGGIAYGNAVGSIICNAALISAVTVTLRPCNINKNTLIVPVIFFFVAAVFYSATAYITGTFNRITGIVLLIIFIAYMALIVFQMMKRPVGERAGNIGEELGEIERTGNKGRLIISIVSLIIGAALIAVGANLLVNNGTKIAEAIGVPEKVIGVTFVAIGTSLPELVTAVTSIVKGHSALSLGNVIGANLFNLVLVNGISTVIKPFEIPQSSTVFGINSSLVIDIPVMFAVMIILTFPAIFRGKLSRVQGITLLCIYAAFCTLQFVI